MSNEISFITTAAGDIYDLVITALEENVKEPLFPGDERRIFGEGFVAVVVALFNTMNDQARQSLLRYARGVVLDAMGERVNTPRIGPEHSKTVLRFAVKQALSQNVTIPAGTRATPDSTHYYATRQIVVLEAGQLSVEVPAEAVKGGTEFNGFKAGTINTLVDQVPYISSVENISETIGGTDGEPYDEEGDDSYRERIRLAPASFSTAGPSAAYAYHTLSADSTIKDVRILSDQEAGTINIVVLMENGEGPPDETVQRILKVANDEKVRPMNDWVTVDAPEHVEYDISLHYYVSAEKEEAAVKTIEGSDGAIVRYRQWQEEKIARAINPDKLRAYILCPHWEEGLTGADRVEITSPTYQEIGQRGVARFSGNFTITHETVKE